MKEKDKKDFKKYQRFSKLDATVKRQSVLKCIVNVLIFKFSVIKTVIVVDVQIKKKMTNTKKLYWMLSLEILKLSMTPLRK